LFLGHANDSIEKKLLTGEFEECAQFYVIDDIYEQEQSIQVL